MKIIGLTGGIGSGKSTVSGVLAELGVVVIDADKIGHQVFKAGTGAWRQVVAEFGRGILSPSDDIDRRKLGEIVFHNPEAMEKLNRIMHPRILEVIKAQLEEYRCKGAKVVVIEATLLIEAGWTSLVDEVWVTVAPRGTVLERLKERGLSEAEVLARIMSQMSAEERVKRAHVTIYNEVPINELKAKVKQLWHERIKD
ncbi:MAG: dephospho-CoA kinase [Dehalococcoidia bacterium]|nr:dephospho-CoA kinase [Dehalococcoidia bacterium]